MIRHEMVDQCLSCARAALPAGPWCFVVVDFDYKVIDEKVFSPDEESKARQWLLKRVQQIDRAIGFRPFAAPVLGRSGDQ